MQVCEKSTDSTDNLFFSLVTVFIAASQGWFGYSEWL